MGTCGLADQIRLGSLTEVVGSSPITVNMLCPYKALDHNYSSRPRCIDGYRPCWEGNRFVVEEVESLLYLLIFLILGKKVTQPPKGEIEIRNKTEDTEAVWF